MNGLKDLLKKKDKIGADAKPAQQAALNVPEFTFVRTTTESEEIIQPPEYPEDSTPTSATERKPKEQRHHLGFRYVY